MRWELGLVACVCAAVGCQDPLNQAMPQTAGDDATGGAATSTAGDGPTTMPQAGTLGGMSGTTKGDTTAAVDPTTGGPPPASTGPAPETTSSTGAAGSSSGGEPDPVGLGQPCDEMIPCVEGAECCNDMHCAGLCMVPCGNNGDCPVVPDGMACSHGYCMFPCEVDADCEMQWPGYTCEHGGLCENQG